MQLLPANDTNIAYAANILKNGGLVAFPTETVYGLGADALNVTAVKRIFTAKGRPADHPLIVHIAKAQQLTDWADVVPDAAYQLAEHFWPGPLTLVLAKQAKVSFALTGGQQTVALRMPQHPVALALLMQFGGGIAAPSANRFCRISPTHALHVQEELGDSIDLILDGGACQVGLESTIVDVSGAQPRLLRPGKISALDIEAVLQKPLLLPTDLQTLKEVRVPGMHAIHYAPLTPAKIYTGIELCLAITSLQAQRLKVGALHYTPLSTLLQPDHAILLPNNASDYARGLYAALRELDKQQLDIILIEKPSQTVEWQAVNDRLQKATQ